MAVMERVMEFLAGYPALENLQADCVPEMEGFSLSTVAVEPLMRRYLDGSEKRQLHFTLLGRRGYGEDVTAQQESLRWFADFEAWLRKQNVRSMVLDAGQKALVFQPVTTAALEEIGENGLCCWGLTLELQYLQQNDEGGTICY